MKGIKIKSSIKATANAVHTTVTVSNGNVVKTIRKTSIIK